MGETWLAWQTQNLSVRARRETGWKECPTQGPQPAPPKLLSFSDWSEAKGDHCQKQVSFVKTARKSVTFLFCTRCFIFFFMGNQGKKHIAVYSSVLLLWLILFVSTCVTKNSDGPLLCVT